MSYGKKPINLGKIFIEVYKAFPAKIVGRDDIETTNNIILPLSAFKKLPQDTEIFFFGILNIVLNIYTHCGVLEFTSEEGTCYLPSDMFERLCLEEGQKVNIRALSIEPGIYIKIRPHKTEFINILQAKSILEYNLRRNYICVTEGDLISVKLGNEYYKMDILECKPKKAIRTINNNLVIDFAPHRDNKGSELKKTDKNVIESNIKEKEEKNQDIHLNNEEERQKNNIKN